MEGKFIRVGVREFRESMAEYVTSPNVVAVTRHGRTVGYYIPARQSPPAEEELEAFERAVKEMQALMQTYGIDPEDVLRDFDAARHRR